MSGFNATALRTGAADGFTQWRADARVWLRERRFELLILLGLWAVLMIVIYWLAAGHVSPRRYQDEFLFWGLAKNFAHGDGLTWRGVGIDMKSWLYPVLLAPAFWIANTVPGEYTGVHLINSMMISATIFPAYLLGRLFVERERALLVALLTVSVPAMNYAGIIGTENLGYFMFTAAAGAILLATARPRLRNTALAIVLILISALTRTQFIVLLPIFLVTVLLAAVMREPGTRVDYLREQRWLVGGLIALFVLGGLAFLIQGKAAVGLYAGVFDGISVTTASAKFWIKSFSADVYLLAGIVPVIATFAMFGEKENRRDPLIGALLALAIVASVALVLQISWFSATNPYDWRARHIFYERYMFYLGPIFFAGLIVAWKRVSLTAAVVSTAVATLVVSGFQTDAVLVPFSYDSFGLSLVGRHMASHPDSVAKIGMDLARITLLLGIVYIVSTLPNKWASRIGYWGLVAFTFIVLIATQAQTWHYARLFSAESFAQQPKPADFIDRATNQDVGMIVTSTDDPLSYFTTEFWNNQIVRAFATDVAPISSPVMYSPRCTFDWAKDGQILGTGCDKVPTAWYLRSDNVVMHLKDEYKRVHPSSAWPNMTLMVGTPPARILSLIDGRAVRTGAVNGALNARTFLDRPGEIRVTVATGGQTVVVGDSRGGSIVPSHSTRSVILKVPADETYSTFTFKTPGGVPTSATVSRLDVREPGTPWRTIL